MNSNKVISTAVLFLLLGTTLPAFAQKGEEEKGGREGKGQQTQRQQQPEHAQQAQRQQAPHTQQPQRTQQAQHQQQPQRTQHGQGQQRAVASNRGGGQYGRISNASYGSHFGHDHSFRMRRPTLIGGYNRFQYGGYWFGYNQGWPADWNYDDDMYVEYVGGYYYMYDLRHPGIHVTLNIF
jgi:hypothetical protein